MEIKEKNFYLILRKNIIDAIEKMIELADSGRRNTSFTYIIIDRFEISFRIDYYPDGYDEIRWKELD